MGQTATAYQSLQTELAQLYNEYNALSTLKKQLGTEYSQVKSIWQQLSFKYQYPQLEAELNTLIANYTNCNTPTGLIPEIESHLVNLRIIDSGAEVLHAKCQQYKQIPNRNGWTETVGKLKMFLGQLPSLPLKHLKDAAQIHLPKAQQAIANMEIEIMNEQSSWSRLEREARAFKSLLDSHRQTIDCHGFFVAYQSALHFVDRLIQSPNMTQLALEEQELCQHRDAITQCLKLFDEERVAICTYEPFGGWGQLWREDVLDVRNMAVTAEENIYTSSIRLAQIAEAASEAIKRKQRDIEVALAPFNPETREAFRVEIKDLQENDRHSTLLIDLVANMKDYEAQKQKAFLLKIAKWVAWILGGLLLLGGLYWLFSAYGTYIVIGLIVIGLIAKALES